MNRQINAIPLEEIPDLEKINQIDFLVPGKMINEKLNRILSMLAEKNKNEIKEIMNIEELAEYTGFSVPRLYKFKLDGKLPYNQSGRKGKIIFIKKDIDFWLATL